ncbi:MAG: DEAD/DEAH box helicase [Legionella sp.]|nr:DEAD/DEAH box helicase [Legionella sp.]
MLDNALARMASVFLPRNLQEGQRYQQSGYVLDARLCDGLFRARVKGESNRIYNIYMDLKSWPTTPATCSCVQRLNCKHAAAGLLALFLNARKQLPPEWAEQVGASDTLQESKRLRFYQASTPRVRIAGINELLKVPVEHGSDFPLKANETSWFSEVDPLDTQAFSYQLGVILDGKSVNLIPFLRELKQRLQDSSLADLSDDTVVQFILPDEKILTLQLGRLKPLLYFLMQYDSETSKVNSLDLTSFQLLRLQDLEKNLSEAPPRWMKKKTIRARLQHLLEGQNFPAIAPPKGLKANLRDYQQEGLNWLQLLRAVKLGGVLADDMGLGKTVQTLAHLQVEKEKKRLKKASLIVAPTSVIRNWEEEAKRFTPSLKVLVFHGQLRHNESFDGYDVVISTYGLLRRDKLRFLNYTFYYFILDEAQSIKNSRAKTTQLIQKIAAEHRLCLSGTPVENHLGELWSLFHFLMPGLLGDTKQFKQFFKKPIEQYQDEERRKLLGLCIRPFIMRRTKDQVAPELPPKTEVQYSIELMGSQKDLYETIRLSLNKSVREAIINQGFERSRFIFLDALLKLRQICCDPRLLSLPGANTANSSSAKLEALMTLLDNLMEEKRHVLIFSQFTSMLQLIEQQLIKQNYPYLKLTGKTINREAVIAKFQRGEQPILLISLKAGGTGLNLTRADTVIHYDPWWNPAVEDQATDRSHRIGQNKPVFVYKLVTVGTVEEAILGLQSKKRQLVDGILSNDAKDMGTLKLEDLDTLFTSPLAS